METRLMHKTEVYTCNIMDLYILFDLNHAILSFLTAMVISRPVPIIMG